MAERSAGFPQIHQNETRSLSDEVISSSAYKKESSQNFEECCRPISENVVGVSKSKKGKSCSRMQIERENVPQIHFQPKSLPAAPPVKLCVYTRSQEVHKLHTPPHHTGHDGRSAWPRPELRARGAQISFVNFDLYEANFAKLCTKLGC